MQNTITCEDIMASKEKFGCILECDTKNYSDLREKNPKSKYDVTYIPIKFKHVNGKKMDLKLKFNEQIISANVKNPSGNDDEIPKNLNISFMRLDKDTVEGGDYVPKKRDSDEAQTKEDTRMSTNIDRYLVNNDTWIKVLDIIADSYKTICEDLITNQSKYKFTLRKDRKRKEVGITEFRQVSREDKDTKQDIVLDNPIYRFKLGVSKNKDHSEYDGRIGYYSKYYNKFNNTVYDARKMNAKNNYAKVPAMIKVKGARRPLDVSNASAFITYKSLVGGTWALRSVCASKNGLSPDNNFNELYVYRHKTKMTSQALTNTDIMQMRGGDESDDESDAEVEEEKEADSDADDDTTSTAVDKDAEPEDSDEEEEDDADEKTKDADEEEDDDDDDDEA